MSKTEAYHQLKAIAESIRQVGDSIEKKSKESDAEVQECLKNGKEMCEKYLKPFNDSFNI